jgi:lipopolysaccharide transport system permease protein
VSAVPRYVITPPTRLNMPQPRELFESRDVLYRFGVRDILLRYRQTAVGASWVVIQPLAAAGIFSLVFGGVADLPSGGTPYFLFSFAGLLGWNLVNGVISRSAPSLVANQGLVSKVYFPRLLVPFSTMLSVLLDFVIALALFVVLLFVYGVNPGLPVLTLPLWVAAALLLAAGIGVACSAVTVKYRDINYALPWLLQIFLYASPVAYALTAVPERLLWLFQINPFTWMLEGFRWALLGQAAPPAWQMIGLAVVAVVSFIGGTAVFQKMEREFADVI